MIPLSLGEEVILSGHGKYGNTQGVLYLTNRRIVFEYERGFISKTTVVPVNFPLSTIAGVSVGGLIKKLVITVQRGVIPGPINYEFNIGEPERWARRIQMAMSETPSTVQRTVQAKRCISCGNLAEAYMTYCPVCRSQLM
ncbi:MAG: hypothetical protein ABH874_01550 [Methanobacteriota archaeon]